MRKLSLFIQIPKKSSTVKSEEKNSQEISKIVSVENIVARIDKINPYEDLDIQIAALVPVLLNLSPKVFHDGFWNNDKIDEEIYTGNDKAEIYDPKYMFSLRSQFQPILLQKIAENPSPNANLIKYIIEGQKSIDFGIQETFAVVQDEINSIPEVESKGNTEIPGLSPVSESNSDTEVEEEEDVNESPSPTAIVSRGNVCWSKDLSSPGVSSPVYGRPLSPVSPSINCEDEGEEVSALVARGNKAWFTT